MTSLVLKNTIQSKLYVLYLIYRSLFLIDIKSLIVDFFNIFKNSNDIRIYNKNSMWYFLYQKKIDKELLRRKEKINTLNELEYLSYMAFFVIENSFKLNGNKYCNNYLLDFENYLYNRKKISVELFEEEKLISYFMKIWNKYNNGYEFKNIKNNDICLIKNIMDIICFVLKNGEESDKESIRKIFNNEFKDKKIDALFLTGLFDKYFIINVFGVDLEIENWRKNYSSLVLDFLIECNALNFSFLNRYIDFKKPNFKLQNYVKKDVLFRSGQFSDFNILKLKVEDLKRIINFNKNNFNNLVDFARFNNYDNFVETISNIKNNTHIENVIEQQTQNIKKIKKHKI